MVRPRDFGFNEETALDNEFQTRPEAADSEINRRANVEFQNMVDRLRAEGIDVMVLEPDDQRRTKVPDAVFPNNWFSTHRDGTLITYPMMAPSRRAEVRPADIERLLRQHGRAVKNLIRFGDGEHQPEKFLEGTGALVIDRADRVVYAARSQRCDTELFERFIRFRAYKEGILFDALSSSGKPVYHTNVMMNLGGRYAVICAESIRNAAQRARALQSLGRSFDVLEISLEQMEKHYCGNILQLRNRDGGFVIVMSARAEKGFTLEQRERLSAYGKIVSVDLETIETIGGGSARCMLAEVFLPRDEVNLK
ncbi:MAG: hypothetical protein KKE86_11275 [Planctomycetes bacterium]|nr:hypothetical protein [Planctomycetota bacterium]